MLGSNMTTLAEFNSLRADLWRHVDVLIQHSENYYVICREAVKREPEPGGRSFNLIRRAVGHEIVSRLYRLIENISGGNHFPAMITQLSDDGLLSAMMPTFDHDGRKSLPELKRLRDEVLSSLRTSARLTNLGRPRFTAIAS